MTSGSAPAALPLFVYGTLLDEALTAKVLGHGVRSELARLLDFELLQLESLAYPTVSRVQGKTIEGRLFRGLTRDDLARLDAHEGVEQGLYRRVEARVVTGSLGHQTSPEPAFVYVMTEEYLPPEGFFRI